MNRKAGALEILLFVMALMVVISLWTLLSQSAAITKKTTRIAEFGDQGKKIAIAITNNPACLGTGTRGIIDKDKIGVARWDCVRNPPFFQKFEVVKIDDNNEEVSLGESSPTFCTLDGDKISSGLADIHAIPVMIKDGEEYYPGYVKVTVGVIDFFVDVEEVRLNTGTHSFEIVNITATTAPATCKPWQWRFAKHSARRQEDESVSIVSSGSVFGYVDPPQEKAVGIYKQHISGGSQGGSGTIDALRLSAYITKVQDGGNTHDVPDWLQIERYKWIE